MRAMVTCDDIRELDPRGPGLAPLTEPLLSSLAVEGPAAFADNVASVMRLIDAFGVVLPLVVIEPHPRLADVCSPVARYAGYPCSEAARRAPWALAPVIRTVFGAWSRLLSAGCMERAVYVNNWILSTNPARPLTADQYRRLNAWLRQRYPSHAIVHRTVNPFLNPGHAEALRAAGCRLVGTRIVYVLDPKSRRFRRSSDVARDRRLLRSTPYRPLDVSGPEGVDLERMTSLYRSLYLDKHCEFNVAFNARFFERVLRTPFFHTRLFVGEGGRMDAFGTHYINDGYVTGALVGYDLSQPQTSGLYRMALMHKAFVAEELGLLLNLSGGCGGFKCHRGAFPVAEYDAVDDRHLPAWRRLPWRLVELEARLWRRQGAQTMAEARS
jgi:hypothetical protein